jgi:hypothetical protein
MAWSSPLGSSGTLQAPILSYIIPALLCQLSGVLTVQDTFWLPCQQTQKKMSHGVATHSTANTDWSIHWT